MKELKFKGFEFEEELLEWVNTNRIEPFTITAQGIYKYAYAVWYY